MAVSLWKKTFLVCKSLGETYILNRGMPSEQRHQRSRDWKKLVPSLDKLRGILGHPGLAKTIEKSKTTIACLIFFKVHFFLPWKSENLQSRANGSFVVRGLHKPGFFQITITLLAVGSRFLHSSVAPHLHSRQQNDKGKRFVFTDS